MNLSAITRIMTGCSWRAQRNLLRFAWNGHRAVRAFERRMKRGEPFFPAFLMLSITNRCNLKCRGCWVSQTNPPCHLSLEQMQGIIDTAAKYKSRFFGILGGEPLFHPDLMTLFRNNPRAYFQLYTNGTMLDKKTAAELAKLGNVTALVSIEGLETESRRRRGRDDVFARSMAGLEAAVNAGLFTGVTASINKQNFDELVSREYLDFLVGKGVHYIWYFIYRPCGTDPEYENALDREHVLKLRQFLVEQRRTAKILILDAYWDADGRALCPGAMGLSHHIAPNGAVEFCPIMQAAGGFLDKTASNLESVFQQKTVLANLREFSSSQGRDCMVLHSPHELCDHLKSNGAQDSSGRDGFFRELADRPPMCCHDVPGFEIPEQDAAYRFGKRNYFFGFGAYG
ncbi:MAG: radical SAM protein [Lentisphaeria bacterium]|nr:radical SAM protein [Lentisphaeria bacterium]